MKFRPIKLSDYPNLIYFWKNHYFVNELDDYERFKIFLDKNPNLSILAEEKDNIVGTALGSFDGRRGYIQKLVVDKNYRKQGIGQKLIEKVTKKLQSLGALYIPVSCEMENVSFFEKSGFNKTNQVTMSISKSHYKKPQS